MRLLRTNPPNATEVKARHVPHRLRSKPLNVESADAGLDSVAIDRALLVSESVHRENCPLRCSGRTGRKRPHGPQGPTAGSSGLSRSHGGQPAGGGQCPGKEGGSRVLVRLAV